MEWILNLDADILLFLQDTVRTPFLNPIISGLTALGNSGLIWVVATLALAFFPKTRKIGLTGLLALLISLLVNNVILKNLVARIRPYEVVEGLVSVIGKQWDYSFPSGHTGSSFAAAWVFFRKLPKKFGIPALVLAALIGLSRLYLGVHYPTDVLFGVISGIGSGCVASMIADRVKSGSR